MSIDELLKLLDEPEVQEKIKLILTDVGSIDPPSVQLNGEEELNQRISNLEQENQKLKKENEEMTGMMSRLKKLIFGKDNELSENKLKVEKLEQQVATSNQLITAKSSELKSSNIEIVSLKERLDIADTKINWYREHFSEDLKLQEIYSNLSESTKGSLSGIFKDTTLKGLVACGIQEKNIGNLWEYAKNEVVNDNNPDIPAIITLFEILFARFSLAFSMYEPQKVASGDSFDTQLHIKHNSSKNVSGAIESVSLHGYVNTKTDKVIKLSIVKI